MREHNKQRKQKDQNHTRNTFIVLCNHFGGQDGEQRPSVPSSQSNYEMPSAKCSLSETIWGNEMTVATKAPRKAALALEFTTYTSLPKPPNASTSNPPSPSCMDVVDYRIRSYELNQWSRNTKTPLLPTITTFCLVFV